MEDGFTLGALLRRVQVAGISEMLGVDRPVRWWEDGRGLYAGSWEVGVMRYCPNDDCPDFVAIGFRQNFTPRTSVCPVCGTHLVEGEPPTEETAPPLAMDRPSFDSPVPGILGGSPTGSIQSDESETLCQSCAAPVEPGVRFCEKCEQPREEAESGGNFVYRFLHSIRSWWGGNR